MSAQRISVGVEDAAAAVGLGESTIRREVRRGRLRVVPHMGTRILIPWLELERVYGYPALPPLAADAAAPGLRLVGEPDVVDVNRHAVQALREAKGLTVSQAAGEAHMAPSTWSQIEQGSRAASADMAARMARALQAPVEAILRAGGDLSTDRRAS